ncbi:hypothetical protein LRP88_12669 [Fusarium phalaenopsidis]
MDNHHFNDSSDNDQFFGAQGSPAASAITAPRQAQKRPRDDTPGDVSLQSLFADRTSHESYRAIKTVEQELHDTQALKTAAGRDLAKLQGKKYGLDERQRKSDESIAKLDDMPAWKR